MPTPAFIVSELKSDGGETIATVPVPVKQFKTGSRGYYANQKIEISGVRYQVQIQLVEIGSKKTAAVETEVENG